MKFKFSAIIAAVAMAMTLSTGSLAAPQDDLLSEFSSGSAVAEAMTTADLGSVRGEGTFTQTFNFPHLNRDIDRTFQFDTTTIHIVGVAATGDITVTIDSPMIPD